MGLQLQIVDAFSRAWLEPLPSLRFVQGLKAHADPPRVATIFRCNPNFRVQVFTVVIVIAVLLAVIFELI